MTPTNENEGIKSVNPLSKMLFGLKTPLNASKPVDGQAPTQVSFADKIMLKIKNDIKKNISAKL